MNKKNRAKYLVDKINTLNCWNPEKDDFSLACEIAFDIRDELVKAEISKDTVFFEDLLAAVKIHTTKEHKALRGYDNFGMLKYVVDEQFANSIRDVRFIDVKIFILYKYPNSLEHLKSEKAKDALIRRVIKAIGLNIKKATPGPKPNLYNY